MLEQQRRFHRDRGRRDADAAHLDLQGAGRPPQREAANLPWEDGTLEKAHLPCRDVPVMDIVAAFRKLAGEAGRRPHRCFPVPVYEYEKGRTPMAKEMIAKALTGQVPMIEKEKVGPSNAELPKNEDADGEVDATTDGGHFARFGEPAPVNLGPDAGEHLGTHRMGGQPEME